MSTLIWTGPFRIKDLLAVYPGRLFSGWAALSEGARQRMPLRPIYFLDPAE